MFFVEIRRTTGSEEELRMGGRFRSLLQGRAQLNARPADRDAGTALGWLASTITRQGRRVEESFVRQKFSFNLMYF
jgi:hypothetical protein